MALYLGMFHYVVCSIHVWFNLMELQLVYKQICLCTLLYIHTCANASALTVLTLAQLTQDEISPSTVID